MSNTYNIVVHPISGYIHPFGKPLYPMSPSGVVTVTEGQSITFSMFGATGGILQDVLVDDISVGTVNQYTFDNVNSDHKISAIYSY
jgi:hypothetical protein